MELLQVVMGDESASVGGAFGLEALEGEADGHGTPRRCRPASHRVPVWRR